MGLIAIVAVTLLSTLANAEQLAQPACPDLPAPTGTFQCESNHPRNPYHATLIFGTKSEFGDGGAVDVINRGITWHTSWEPSREEGECPTMISITVNTNQTLSLDYYVPLKNGRYFGDVQYRHKEDFVMINCRREN